MVGEEGVTSSEKTLTRFKCALHFFRTKKSLLNPLVKYVKIKY